MLTDVLKLMKNDIRKMKGLQQNKESSNRNISVVDFHKPIDNEIGSQDYNETGPVTSTPLFKTHPHPDTHCTKSRYVLNELHIYKLLM